MLQIIIVDCEVEIKKKCGVYKINLTRAEKLIRLHMLFLFKLYGYGYQFQSGIDFHLFYYQVF